MLSVSLAASSSLDASHSPQVHFQQCHYVNFAPQGYLPSYPCFKFTGPLLVADLLVELLSKLQEQAQGPEVPSAYQLPPPMHEGTEEEYRSRCYGISRDQVGRFKRGSTRYTWELP